LFIETFQAEYVAFPFQKTSIGLHGTGSSPAKLKKRFIINVINAATIAEATSNAQSNHITTFQFGRVGREYYCCLDR